MIGIDGQFVFRFNVGDKDDFISEEDFTSFLLVEEAGNVLPTFQIGFNTSDESVLNLLNETNNFEVAFGKSKDDDLTTTPLAVMNKSVNRSGNTKRTVQVNGLYSALDYITSSKQLISSKKSAISVMKDVASNHFNYPTTKNILTSIDSQIWIQPNTSDKKFVNELWLHSDLGSSFPVVGITSGGDFIVKDLKKEGLKPFDWRFTHRPVLPTDLQYDGDYVTNDKTGFINSWVGYGREKTLYDIEGGLEETVCEIPEPVVALTSKLARLSEIEKRYTTTGVKNTNQHANYWKSALHNLTNLASLSSSSITLSFHDKFVPIKVLDKVMFTDDDVSENRQASGYNSGIYFVTRVARNLGGRQFSTVVELTRESFNEIKTV